MIRFGVQPSEIAQMTMAAISALLDVDGDVVTLADTAALHRFMAAHG